MQAMHLLLCVVNKFLSNFEKKYKLVHRITKSVMQDYRRARIKFKRQIKFC